MLKYDFQTLKVIVFADHVNDIYPSKTSQVTIPMSFLVFYKSMLLLIALYILASCKSEDKNQERNPEESSVPNSF